MTAAELQEAEPDLWQPVPVGASNARRARVYAARANAFIASALLQRDSHPLFDSGKVSRQALAAAIGCGPSTITQNRSIRDLLKRTDRFLSLTHLPPKARELRRAVKLLRPEATKVRPLQATARASRIVNTSNELRLYGRPYPDIPTIVFADGIHLDSSDWLRQVRIDRDMTPQTGYQYATLLRPFLLEMRAQGKDFTEVYDADLITWRNNLAGNSTKKKRHANTALQIIFDFFLFCEQTARFKRRVGCYERSELPSDLKGIHFPISAVPAYSTKGGFRWVSPLLFRTVPSSIGNRGTPDDEAMKKVHRLLRGTRHELRTATTVILVEDSGARVSEILQMKASDIPEEDALLEALEKGESCWEVVVVRKGGTEEKLLFSSDALLEARAYLRFRKALIETVKVRYKKKGKVYTPPPDLFLSERGTPIQADSVTKIVSTLFRQAGLKNTGIHRIRAKFVIDLIDEILDSYLESGLALDAESAWVETIVQQAAARMGHRSVGSLKHYLHSALERRLRLSRRHESLREASDSQNTQVTDMLKVLDAELRKEAERFTAEAA